MLLRTVRGSLLAAFGQFITRRLGRLLLGRRLLGRHLLRRRLQLLPGLPHACGGIGCRRTRRAVLELRWPVSDPRRVSLEVHGHLAGLDLLDCAYHTLMHQTPSPLRLLACIVDMHLLSGPEPSSAERIEQLMLRLGSGDEQL